MSRLIDALDSFWGYLSSIGLGALALGVAAHLLKTVCTSRAWRNVIAASYPDQHVRWRSIYAAYIAGVGVNAIMPARAGDVVRLYLAHRAVPGSTYATLLSSTAVLAVVDITLALALFSWALTQDLLPSLEVLPSLPSFDFHWFLDHALVGEVLVAAIALAVVVLVIWARAHVEHLREQLAEPFRILGSPCRYVRTVAVWQLADWSLRLVTIWCFLGAFGIDQTPHNVLLAQVAASLSTLVPISPGGVGTEQALITYVFRGIAPASVVIPFSVGMKVTLTAVNVVLGFAALALTMRTVRLRGALRRAREARKAAQPDGS